MFGFGKGGSHAAGGGSHRVGAHRARAARGGTGRHRSGYRNEIGRLLPVDQVLRRARA